MKSRMRENRTSGSVRGSRQSLHSRNNVKGVSRLSTRPNCMKRTSNVFVRVEPEVKEQAEKILSELGIPMSNAVGMFLRQVVLQRGIPFEMKLPKETPLAFGSLTKEERDRELEKGMEDIREGRVYSAESVLEELHRDYGV